MYIEGNNQTELCHKNPDILERALSNTIMGKNASYKTTRSWENLIQTTEERKWFSFQTNYD